MAEGVEPGPERCRCATGSRYGSGRWDRVRNCQQCWAVQSGRGRLSGCAGSRHCVALYSRATVFVHAGWTSEGYERITPGAGGAAIRLRFVRV